MKTPATALILLAACTGLAKAEWYQPSYSISWEYMCEVAPSQTPIHVCFKASTDISKPSGGDFKGVLGPDKYRFLIYQSLQDSSTYQNDHYTIKIDFITYSICSNYNVKDRSGRLLKSGKYCAGDPVVTI